MAQLTLSQRAALAEDNIFRSRLFQGLFAKANFHRSQSNPANLKAQKQQSYADPFVIGGANSIDIHANTRFWLANYNEDPPQLDVDNQPTDAAILDTNALDVVYDTLAGVQDGDENLPIIQ